MGGAGRPREVERPDPQVRRDGDAPPDPGGARGGRAGQPVLRAQGNRQPGRVHHRPLSDQSAGHPGAGRGARRDLGRDLQRHRGARRRRRSPDPRRMRIRAFAPGTVANLGPGLDVLGLALTGPGDSVSVERSTERGIRIRDAGHPDIPTEASRNTAGIAAAKVLEKAGSPGTGLVIDVAKGLPLSGGQGGSAASAAAAAVAVNALLGSPLSREDLLDACLDAEEAVAGRHADNVAAALFGGVILVRSLDPPDVVQLAYPDGLRVVLVEPDQRLRTAEARAALPVSIERGVAIEQAAQ